MSAELQNIQAHLQEQNKNFIDVLNLETERYIKRKLSLDEINNQYGSIENYLTELVKQGISKIQVYRRKKQGNTSALIGSGLNLEIGEQKPENVPTPVVTETPQSTNSFGLNNSREQTYSPREMYQDKIILLNEKISELKDTISDLKQNKRTNSALIKTLQMEINGYKVDLATFEKNKELDLKLQALESKSFFDSEMGKSLAEEAMGLAASFAQKTPAPQGGQLASPSQNQNISASKKALFQILEKDHATDDVCAKLYYTLVGLIDPGKTEFQKELTNLLNTHNLKNQN